MLDVGERLPAPWTQTEGPQASRQTAPFIHDHCQKKADPQGSMLAAIARDVALCNSWVIFCGKMPLRVTQRAGLWIFADSPDVAGTGRVRLWLSHFIFIYLFADEYTHSSQTFRGRYPTPEVKKASATHVVMWNDEQIALTQQQQPKPSVSFLFLLMIHWSCMNRER